MGLNSFGQQGFRVGAYALPQTVWLLNDDDNAAPAELYSQEWLAGMAGGLSFGYVHPYKGNLDTFDSKMNPTGFFRRTINR